MSAVARLNHPISRMIGRDPDDQHRVSTALELLFDLAFAAAFGIAGSQFAHVLAEGHVAVGLGAMAFSMFAIVWAWINFTWFASAYDTDDWFYRVTTMVQMTGVVILALGLPDVFHSLDTGHGLNNGVLVAGYVVMRVAMLTQWLRLAYQAPEHRRAALVYAAFILVAQIGWVMLALSGLTLAGSLAAAGILYAIELGGPLVTERGIGRTPWHPHHIAERYGLMTLIALGEGVLGTIASVEPITAEHGWTSEASMLVAAGTLLTFGVWWAYFSVPFGEILQRNPRAAFVFGYGHLLIFASIAAMGAGLHLAAYVVSGTAQVGWPAAVQAVAMPVGVFMVSFFAIYSLMVRRIDLFHLLMFTGVVVVLATAVILAGIGISFGICMLIVALAPAIMVVGFELVGHQHTTDHLDALTGASPQP